LGIQAIIRAAQSRVPWIRPAKFAAYNFAARQFGLHVEPEFRLLSRLAPSGLALDVGGNWGQSIIALQRWAKPARIVSFEPNPILATRLKRHHGNQPSVSIEQFALSDSAGAFTLYIPHYYDYVYDGLASLNRSEAEGWFTPARFAGFDPSRLHIQSVEIETRTLDSLGVNPEIVKIDVQGAEALVIAGATRTFARCQPVTLMESVDDAMVERMAGFGLNAYFFNGTGLADWRDYTNNVIFLTDEHRDKIGL
jgi:FkbM family methyltransferase